MSQLSPYERTLELINSAEGNVQPDFLHGSICGLLCAGGRIPPSHQKPIFMKLIDSESSQVDTSEVKWLIDFCMSELSSEEMSFRPMVPDDDQPMQLRLAALITWTSAFLSGFGTSGQDFSNLSEDSREVLTDLAEVCRISPIDDESTEDDWVIVLEHVRLSALHLFLAFNTPEGDDNTETVIH